jgi:uncharacterized membrane protein YhaH (DUF805 family)
MMTATVGLWEHFKKLADFNGREDRGSSWPYAALVFLVVMVVGTVIFVPMMANTMQAMQDFAAQHPDQVTVSSGPGHYSMSIQGNPPGIMPPTSSVAIYLGVTFGLSILLYAAAVARRLHDRGISGWWGLMPLPFILYSSIQMPRVFGSFGNDGQPDMTLFFSIFFSNMLYIVTLIVLIVFLAGASLPTPNRYDAGD